MVPGGVDAELFSGSSASAIWSFLFSPEQRASRVRYQSKRRRAIMVIILISTIIIIIVIIVIKASTSIKTKIVETKFPLCTYPILAFFFTWITYLPRILEIFSFFLSNWSRSYLIADHSFSLNENQWNSSELDSNFPLMFILKKFRSSL